MLRNPDHQVAGHRAEDGLRGPRIDGSGKFNKPLQNGGRGSKEEAFYQSLSSEARIPGEIRRCFPMFYGTETVEASDGSGLHPHLVLEDLVWSYKNPSITDIKIGCRIRYPQSSEDHIQKCLQKDGGTSSLSLGFRISGMKVFDSRNSAYWNPPWDDLQGLSPEDAKTN